MAHTFLLGDKYSKPLNATYLDRNGLTANLQMGCYGLGISRLLGAAVEVLSLEQELRWPLILAPYKVVIISPKVSFRYRKGIRVISHNKYISICSSYYLHIFVLPRFLY